MVVWFNKEAVAMVNSETFFDNLACLVIRDIQSNFVSSQFQGFKLLFVGSENGLVG